MVADQPVPSNSSRRTLQAIRRFVVACALVSAIPRAAAAAPPPFQVSLAARSMTLAEALAFAHAHQPALRAARARLAAARADAAVPGAGWSPRVGVEAALLGGTANNSTAGALSLSSVALPRIGGTPMTAQPSLRPYPSTLAAVGVSQEVFDFGRIAAQSAAEDATAEVVEQGAEAYALDVALDVEEAFFAVRAAHSVLDASEQALARAEAHRDLAQAAVRSGLRPTIELTRAEADLTRFELGRARARGGLIESQSVLAAAIGAEDATVDASGDLPADAPPPAFRDVMRQAIERAPDLLVSVARLREQQARTKAIAAEARPDLSLSASLSTRAGGAPPSSGELPGGGGWVPNVPNWDVGLALRWSLFDDTILSRERASRARELARSADVDAARQRTAAAVGKAYLEVEVAADAIAALERAAEAATANEAQVDARFRQGLGTSVELADAETLRTSAEIDLALGRFQLARARARLGREIAAPIFSEER